MVHKDDQELELSAVAGKRAYAHPHLEHLLVEPFRVLNGTDQCPRYILRDFGKGEGFLTIVPQHKPVASLGGACATFNLIETAGYWGYFGKYLDFIATTYDETLYADPNQLTLYHDEVNRAVVGGSYWIVSLALSSAVEGLCRMHPAWATTPSPVTPEERKRAEEALALLEPGFLQDKLRGALNGACTEQRPQGSPALKVLMAEAVIESRHKKSWESFRHYVAHGNLLDHREPDRRLECFPDLYELFQLLTAERISFSLEDYPLSEGGRMMLENYQNRADKRLL